MKARDKDRTSVLRMILSEVKYAAAAVNIHAELGEDEVAKVVGVYYKRLDKSLADYPEGEKRAQIALEMKIVAEYLPQKATPEQTSAAIDAVLAGTSDRTFGPLMKEVLAKLGSGADGKLV